MTDYHIGSYRSIDAFVQDKLSAFQSGGFTFRTLFTLMFRESDNVLYEKSEGYRIRKTTYGEAKKEILSRAAVLKDTLKNLPHNAVVGLYLDNSLDWIELFWAILAAGYKPLLMNLRLPKPLLLDAMQAADCRAVIAERGEFPCTVLSPEAIPADFEPIDEQPFGTELFVMSSGTTENIKVCAYSAEEFYYQICDSYAIIKEQPMIKKHYEGNLKLLTFLPFYHVFGLIAMYIWFAFFSRTFVQLNDLAPSTIVNTIRRHKVTHIFAVPLFWERVYEQAKKGIADRGEKTAAKFERALALQQKLPAALGRAFAKAAFREVRENLFGDSVLFMISGGSLLDPKVHAFFNGIGYPLANGYGMTEIGITSVELSFSKKYLENGCVGKPMQNVEYRVGSDGVLEVKGRVTARYILTADGRKGLGEWFRTNDLCECIDGHYRILGRVDDLIVAQNGENLNPNAIEPLLKTDGAELCLIPANDNGKPATVLLCGVNRMTTKETAERILASLKERIEGHRLSPAISKIALVEGPLMKADEFKLNRIRLRRDYASGALRPLDLSEKHETEKIDILTARVRAIVAQATNRDETEIAPDADFFLDLGGTSLDYFALLTRLRDEFGAPFPLEETNLKTVRSIAAYIRAEKGGDL